MVNSNCLKRGTYQKRKDRVSCNALIRGTEARIHCKLFVCSKTKTEHIIIIKTKPNQTKLCFFNLEIKKR